MPRTTEVLCHGVMRCYATWHNSCRAPPPKWTMVASSVHVASSCLARRQTAALCACTLVLGVTTRCRLGRRWLATQNACILVLKLAVRNRFVLPAFSFGCQCKSAPCVAIFRTKGYTRAQPRAGLRQPNEPTISSDRSSKLHYYYSQGQAHEQVCKTLPY